MPFSEVLPRWEAAGSAPPVEKQTKGWVVSEKPPADWFNYQWSRSYWVMKELQEKAALAADLTSHMNNQIASVHGSTVAPTAGKLIHRDAAGRAQVAAPAAAGDIANKSTVDGAITTAAADAKAKADAAQAAAIAAAAIDATTKANNAQTAAQNAANTALALKAPLASPALTGTPTAPTAPAGNNTTQLATTAFVASAVAALINAAPGALDTLDELAAALGDDPNFATTITTALGLKAPLASPALTGAPTAPTAAPGTNTTQLATTAFVEAVRAALAATDALKAPIASPIFTGSPTAPTPAAGNNSTQLATTAFVEAIRVALAAADALKAPLASPALTGTPTAPTAAAGTATTQVATTAFVDNVRASLANSDATKAPIASPNFTGVPTAPTPETGTNTTQVATAAFVQATIAALVNAAPGALDTLDELAAALGDDPNFATTITNALALKAPLASPALTGTPTAPTATAGTNNTQVATTAFVAALGSLKANLASPAFTGTPTAPTAAVGTNSTQLATTAFVQAAKASQAIPASTDLNAFRNEGEYYCASNATAATILNMPTAIAGQSFYLHNGTHAGVNQSIVSYNSAAFRIYTRNFYSAATPQWSDWMEIEHSGRKNVASGYAGLDANVKVARANTYNDLGGSSTIPTVDLDLALTAGVYPISPVTLNKPTASMWGQVLVFVSGAETHNNANTWTWQLLLQSSGGSYVRYKDAAAAWSAWVPWWTGNNDAPLFMTRSQIANNTDFNTITANGIYIIYQPTGTTNAPPVTYGVLSISKAGTNYVKQEVMDVLTGDVYSRVGNIGASWTPWVVNITSAGGKFTGPVSRTYSAESVKLSNVASYKSTQNNTGTIKITLPVGWNATMMTIKITGYEYASNRGAWELILGGYNFTNAWSMTSALADSAAGVLPFTSVRFAYDGSKCCILLGTTTNVTQYPHIEVTEVLASHVGASALASAGNWTITNLTSETGITNVVIVPIKWGNADTLSGWSPSQAPTPNTVVVRNSKGEIPGITSTAAKVEDLSVASSTSGVPALAYTPTEDETVTVSVYLSLLYDTKISIYVQYVDPKRGLTAYEFLPVSATALPYDGYVFVPAFIRVKANETVALLVTHNNTANPAYVTAAIRRE